MRFLVIPLTIGLFALPAALPASACGAHSAHDATHSAKATTTDFAAKKKKKVMKKKMKVEYMRAVPSKPPKK
jgi:hypothetical protein